MITSSKKTSHLPLSKTTLGGPYRLLVEVAAEAEAIGLAVEEAGELTFAAMENRLIGRSHRALGPDNWPRNIWDYGTRCAYRHIISCRTCSVHVEGC